LKALFQIAKELKTAHTRNIQIGIVVGGGNIWRGGRDQGLQLDRIIADNMGMLATIINALALQDACEQTGIHTRVLSAVEVAKVSEPFIRRRAVRHLEKGRLVIFAAGTGNPYFSTDTAAALRAVEVNADCLLKATQVDGIYSDDPQRNPAAKLYKRLTFQEAIEKKLKIMDTSALALCQENGLPVRVFNLHKPGNITRALTGEKLGTLVEVN
ncbi:MAG: UMP kinase, partial [Elusimicrobia bacterium]|nr:UMP kinase [Elusimicrobiota bacterium]